MIIFLHYLRVLATVMVIIRHVPNHAIPFSFDWYLIEILKSWSACAVPIFLMASGMLLFNPEREFSPGAFYKKRLVRIGPATLFWTLFYFHFHFFKHFKSTQEFVTDLLQGRPAPHLWFLYMIGFLYFFTPFLRKIAANSSRKEWFVFSVSVNILILLKVTTGLSIGLFPFEFLLYLGYYVLGYSLYLFMKSPLHRYRALFVILISVSVITITVVDTHNIHLAILGGYRLSLPALVLSVCMFLLFMSYEHRLRPSASLRRIDGFGLGIYVVHPVFVKLFVFSYPTLRVDSIWKFLLVVGVGWGLGIVYTAIVKRIPYLHNTV